MHLKYLCFSDCYVDADVNLVHIREFVLCYVV